MRVLKVTGSVSWPLNLESYKFLKDGKEVPTETEVLEYIKNAPDAEEKWMCFAEDWGNLTIEKVECEDAPEDHDDGDSQG